VGAIILSLPTPVFAQNDAVWADVLSSSVQPQLRRIQVGAFRSSASAQKAFDTLQNVGLNPILENHAGFIRVVLPGIEAGHVPSMLAIIGHAGFKDAWVREEPEAFFRLQIGAFRNMANAETAFNTLQTYGLKPAYEDRSGFRRVVLPGISSRNLWLVLDTAYLAGFREIWMRPESATIGPDAYIPGGDAVAQTRAINGTELLTMVLRR